MRLSEFWSLMEQEFGSGYAAVVAGNHALNSLGGRTVDEALEGGERVRRVWEAICTDLEVPPDHHELPDATSRD